jgi:soluble lytic murein transglycosylase-like protein
MQVIALLAVLFAQSVLAQETAVQSTAAQNTAAQNTAAQNSSAPKQPAQKPLSQADRIRAAMEPSLAKQRESVRAQLQALGVNSNSWNPASAPEGADCEPVPQIELARMIDDAAQKENVNPQLVREVARQESGFRPCAVSPKGAQGLMQLMPETQAQFQVKDPFSPKESLEAGSKLLKDLLDRYHGNLSLALGAYNAGAERVDKAGAVPDIPETKNYVFDILTRMMQ